MQSSKPTGSTLIWFGDQAGNFEPRLEQLLRDATKSAAQSRFLQEAALSLKAQIYQLSPVEHVGLPRDFNTVNGLLRECNKRDRPGHPAIASALLCVIQLLQGFYYLEGASYDSDEGDVQVVGLCTGSIAAVALSCCSSIDQLERLAVPSVSIAFQVGLNVARRARLYCNSQNATTSWSMVIGNTTESEIISTIEASEEETGSGMTRKCWVSAVGLNCVTVSGPPPALEHLTQYLSKIGSRKATKQLPIFAPYHAPQLESGWNFSQFLSQCSVNPNLLMNMALSRTVISACTGDRVRGNTALDLMNDAVRNILFKPVHIDKVVNELALRALVSKWPSITIVSIYPATAVEGVELALKSRANIHVSRKELRDLVEKCDSSSYAVDVPLAIVGMSCRFPGADTPEELWKLLINGQDMHREIPKDRFDIDSHVDSTLRRKNTCSTPYGCFIDRPGSFDPRFFNMSPREATQTDPMQRLALMTAYEALENSGFVANRTTSTRLDRVGTFYGQTSDDYRDTNAAQDIGTYFITGGIRAFGPGRINYFFKFSGPSYNVDTACSSSLAAIQLACTSIRNGDCDIAVAGGLSVLSSPDLYAGLSRGHFLSKTGSCKTFDQGADGYCRADGIGTVVIKRLTNAQQDNDRILAVVLGTATNHSAEAVSITHPHAQTQARLFHDVINRSGIIPFDIGYVEMHGTGTQAGDGVEMASVVDVVAPLGKRKADNPVYVGAIKANIGHGEASAGVASLIKALLMFEKEEIPPHIGIKNEMNRGFSDLGLRNVRIPTMPAPFRSRPGRQRTILVNNFSAAGGNTALLLQDPPTPARPYRDPRAVYAVTASGNSLSSLNNNIQRLIEYLHANPSIQPGDVSYTTMARRIHHPLRVTVTGQTIAEIRSAFVNKKALAVPHSPARKRVIVFVFTGQGQNYFPIGHDFYRTSTQFRTDIDSFDQLVLQQGFPSFHPLIDGSASDIEWLSPVQTQVGLVCIQMALARLWRSWGIQPSMAIGHSLGEYATLQASGVLSVADTIFLVGSRARLLEERCQRHSHSMLAVSCPPESLELSLTGLHGVDIACVNSPRETVLSGEKSTMAELDTRLRERGIRTKSLALPYAFHSAQVDPILDGFSEAIKEVDFEMPQIPIISPVTGQLEKKISGEYLLKQARQTVQFSPVIERVKGTGAIGDDAIFLEIGPHPICSEMIKTTLGRDTCTLPTLRRNENPWAVVAKGLAELHDTGYPVDWAEYFREFERAHQLLNLPSYAFDISNYWIDYRNDWSLRKGDLPDAPTKPQIPSKLSKYVHRVVKESYDVVEPMVLYEADLGDENLHSAISGHRVNGCALCPSSLYADIALTVADHLQRHVTSTSSPLDARNITSMEVNHPLIAGPLGSETRALRITAKIDKVSFRLRISFSTVDSNNDTQHAQCSIEYGVREAWLSEWSRNAHLVQERVNTLNALVATGEVGRIPRKLAYRLFRSLVDYAPEYQLMNQVDLASSTLEATCKIKLEGDNGPHWIDALAHISGFVLNANEDTESAEAVYISHGWAAMRFGKPLQAGQTYQTYVKMRPNTNSLMDGNVWILSGEMIVGLIEGIRFQKIPRRVLNMLLPSSGSIKTPQTDIRHSEAEVRPPEQPCLERSARNASQGCQSASLRDRCRHLIAEELGLPSGQPADQDNLSDIGLDSLMSLTLTCRLQEEMEIEVSHQALYECATTGELLDVLDRAADSDHVTPCQKTDKPQEPVPASCSDEALSSSKSWTQAGSAFGESSGNGQSTQGESSTIESQPISQGSIISTRNCFSDTEVPPGLLFESLDGTNECPQSTSNDHEAHPSQPAAKVILLQRRSSPASNKLLFLFPDGSGSPASYAQFDHLSPEFEVYGLVCPYLRIPHAQTNGLAATVDLYLSAIREYQPKGPYHLGGWSIGGVYAYEASNKLAQLQESVALLLLIDSPCPSLFPPMNSRLISFFEALGVFDQVPCDARGRGPVSKREQVLNHFKIATKDLSDYKPVQANTGGTSPRVCMFWAQNGVCEDQKPTKPTGDAKSSTPDEYALDDWILAKRTDFGPGGWETLLPVENMTTRVISGNHFTMMQSPNIEQLSTMIQEILQMF